MNASVIVEEHQLFALQVFVEELQSLVVAEKAITNTINVIRTNIVFGEQ
jgi:hypothetical protein